MPLNMVLIGLQIGLDETRNENKSTITAVKVVMWLHQLHKQFLRN